MTSTNKKLEPKKSYIRLLDKYKITYIESKSKIVMIKLLLIVMKSRQHDMVIVVLSVKKVKIQ